MVLVDFLAYLWTCLVATGLSAGLVSWLLFLGICGLGTVGKTFFVALLTYQWYVARSTLELFFKTMDFLVWELSWLPVMFNISLSEILKQ